MLTLDTSIEQLIDAGERLYRQGLMLGGNGNLSARTDEGIIVTSTEICKGRLRPSDFVLVDGAGSLIRGETPTSELPMHLTIYRERLDVYTVIHVHAPFAVALTVAGLPFRDDLLPEIALKYGRIPVTKFARPSTPESAEVLLPYLKEAVKGAILPHHGIVAMGKTVEETLLIIEEIEYSAKVQILASLVGTPQPYSLETK